jgi:hypothetical protein
VRKAQLASELDADWFMHHDADEFRDSPWPGLSLSEGIALVDRLGYNAIDFALMNFLPVNHEHGGPGDQQRLRHYEPGRWWDEPQITCWKKTPVVDLATSGGHEAQFPGREIFPIRFLLRHYPVRDPGEPTGVLQRKPRFAVADRRRGWHAPTDASSERDRFVRDRTGLIEYDVERARLELWLEHRGVYARERHVRNVEDQLGETTTRLVAISNQLTDTTRNLDETRAALDVRMGQLDRAQTDIDGLHAEIDRLRAEIALNRVVMDDLHERLYEQLVKGESLSAELAAMTAARDAVYGSKSWRVTAALRYASRVLTGAGREPK